MRRLAIFAGSFDPPTLGHADIIHKAQTLCDHLILALPIKPEKESFLTGEEKVQMLKKIAPDAEIDFFDGLIVELAKKKGAAFLIRGLRTSSDFDYEFQMAQANKRLSGIDTIFLIADDRHSQISSTLIRQIAHFKGSLHDFVPKQIEEIIRKKY